MVDVVAIAADARSRAGSTRAGLETGQVTAQRFDSPTDDGVLDWYLSRPAADGPWPAIILYMDAFGIRPALLSMADRLSSHGYVVATPNLYYRSGNFPPFDPPGVMVDGPERVRFKSMIASISDTMVMRDTASLLPVLDALPIVRGGRVAAVGYCMGGGFALSAAGTFPDRVTFAASFHGGGLANDKPDSPHRLAPRIKASIYVGAAGIDPTFTDDQESRLRQAFDDAGVEYTLERYAGAKHGFAVTGHPVYDEAAAERHWTQLLQCLSATMT